MRSGGWCEWRRYNFCVTLCNIHIVDDGDRFDERHHNFCVTLCNFNFYNSERMNEVNFRLGWIRETHVNSSVGNKMTKTSKVTF